MRLTCSTTVTLFLLFLGELPNQEGDEGLAVSEALAVLEDAGRSAGLSPRDLSPGTQGQLPSEAEAARRPTGEVVKLAEDQARADSEDVRNENPIEGLGNEMESPPPGPVPKGELPESG